MSEAVYTEVLKNVLIDTLLDNGYTETDILNMSASEIAENSAPYIFEADIPFFDENYRIPLEKKILRHYFLREIGSETEERFAFYLNTAMHELMPYYNKLYETELFKFNPLYTVDKKTLHTGTQKDDRNIENETNSENVSANETFAEREGKTNQNSASISKNNGSTKENSSSASDGYSQSKGGVLDTPQGALTGLQDSMDIMNGSTTTATGGYLTNAQMSDGSNRGSSASSGTRIDEDEQTQNNSSAANNKEEAKSKDNAAAFSKNKGTQKEGASSTEAYVDHVIGYEGKNASEAIINFRNTFRNLDMELIKDLNNNFMMVY